MMMKLAKKLFPICRSITGQGVRNSFEILREIIPELKLTEVPSGKKVYDWEIPDEWNIEDAYIADEKGTRVVDFKKNNLHLVSYSVPLNASMHFNDLRPHLHFIQNLPTAIPYRTSYYKRDWGFCLSYNQYQELDQNAVYQVVIKAEHKKGSLTYGEVILSGKTKEEVFFSTYICHPSMANNELSGPIIASFVAQWIKAELPERQFSYRFAFVPETIGAITYIHENFEQLKKNIFCGFQLTCIGDSGPFSYIPSRTGKTLADRVAIHCLKHFYPSYKKYSFLNRGSDERQYCHPNVDFPLCSVTRSKYGEYPEYHTSLDNLDFISQSALEHTLNFYKLVVRAIEANKIYVNQTICEPFLGKRGLRSQLGGNSQKDETLIYAHLLAFIDGSKDLLDISDDLERPIWEIMPFIKRLYEEGFISVKNG